MSRRRRPRIPGTRGTNERRDRHGRPRIRRPRVHPPPRLDDGDRESHGDEGGSP